MIDALRGVAALYVVIFHTVRIPEPDLAVPRAISAVIAHGGTGVTLFFILSAFTLCYTLDGRGGDRLRVTKFYIRRLFRIVPLYLVWLAVMLRNYAPGDWTSQRRFILACLTFTYNLRPAWREGIVWASWTLGVEMLFYLIFPLIFRFVQSVRAALALNIVTGAIAFIDGRVASHSADPTARNEHVIHMSLAHQLPVFAVGMLVYFCYRALQRRPAVSLWLGPCLIAAGLASFLAFCLLGDELMKVPILYPISLSFAALTLGLLLSPIAVVANRVTVFFGIISYSMYLNHPKLVSKLEPLFRAIEAKGWPTSVSFALCVLITLMPLALTACATYLLIEQPFIRFGSRVIRWIDPQARRTHSANETPADAVLHVRE